MSKISMLKAISYAPKGRNSSGKMARSEAIGAGALEPRRERTPRDETGTNNGICLPPRSMAIVHLAADGGNLGGEPPFERRFGDKRDQRQQRQKRGDGEGGDEIVLVV